MKRMLLTFVLLQVFTFFLSGCKEDETPDQSISISGIPEFSEIKVDEPIGPFNWSVEGKDGISSISIEINGTKVAEKSFTKEIIYSGIFLIKLREFDIDKSFNIIFRATDKDGDTDEKQLNFTVYSNYEYQKVKSDIESDETWTSDKIYVLDGGIKVKEGVTLTIEPGVIVKGDVNMEKELPSGLIISPGAKIIAEGTASSPIVFTSLSDPYPNLDNSEIGSPIFWDAGILGNGNLEDGSSYSWGGLTILGKGKISIPTNYSETYLDGFKYFDKIGKYGGEDVEDNSGKLEYVTIRHGGKSWAEGATSATLTLAGVGKGTNLKNIEIQGGEGLGLYLRGGNVSISNLIATEQYHNGFNIGEGWSGEIDNFIIKQEIGTTIKIEGANGNFLEGNHKLTRGSIFTFDIEIFIELENSANTDISNLYLYAYGEFFDGPMMINRIPNRYPSQIQDLTTNILESSKFFPDEISKSVKYLRDPANESGADFEEFSKWSKAFINHSPLTYFPHHWI